MEFSGNTSFRRSISYAIMGAALLLLVSCARQGMPSGGPEDRTPPRIIATVPPNRATHVSTSTPIQLTFSEKIEQKSIEDALFLAPAPRNPFRLKWHGKTLSLILPDSLLPNQTYLITIGAGVRDRHGNSMRESFTLAFSTGVHLDNGKITGRVFDKGSARGIHIWGYLLRLAATPDPTTDSPQYVTQCDARGRFLLQNLSPGSYRLFALNDKDRNRRYDPGYDAIGFPTRDASLTPKDSTDGPLFFRVAVQDTTPPEIVSAFATDTRHVQIRMSEPVDSLDAENASNFSISKKNTRQALALQMSYRSFLNSNQIILVTARQDSGQNYIVKLHAIHDRAGNLIGARDSITLRGSARPDTLPPQVVRAFPTDSAKAVLPDKILSCVFSEAIDTLRADSVLLLQNADGDTIQGKIFWPQPDVFQFKPLKFLKGNQVYRWHLLSRHIFDLAGNSLQADSTKIFRVVPEDTLSEISGIVKDADSSAAGPIFLHLSQTNPPHLKKSLKLNWLGAYQFKNILPGSYRISAFRDNDKNGKFSRGQLKPFRFSERFFVYPDTILVRSRWPNDGNDFQLPH